MAASELVAEAGALVAAGSAATNGSAARRESQQRQYFHAVQVWHGLNSREDNDIGFNHPTKISQVVRTGENLVNNFAAGFACPTERILRKLLTVYETRK